MSDENKENLLMEYWKKVWNACKKVGKRIGAVAAFVVIGVLPGKAQSGVSAFAANQKAKTERFIQDRQQKRAEFAKKTKENKAKFEQKRQQNRQQHGADDHGSAQKAWETGITKAAVYAFIPHKVFKINVQKSIDANNGDMFVYVGTEGVAFKIESSPNFYGAKVNERGEIKYYKCGIQDDDKVEVEADPSLVKMIISIDQKHGIKNSNFSKAIAGQEKKNQTVYQPQKKSQKAQAITWAKTKYGYRPVIQPDRGVVSKNLLPRARYNSKTKMYSVGYVKSHSETMARQLAELEIQFLAAEEKIYQDLQKRAETEQLGENEQKFLEAHQKRLDDMELSVGKDGQLQKKANEDTSQVTLGKVDAKTLDNPALWGLRNGGHGLG